MPAVSPPLEVDGADATGGVGRKANCSANTSRRMASGRASRKDGSTPSGMRTPSMVAGLLSSLGPAVSPKKCSGVIAEAS